MINRRQFIKASALASLYSVGSACYQTPRWEGKAYRKKPLSRVAIVKAQNYQTPLKDALLSGIEPFRINCTGRTVVLKPNLVEFDPGGVINTHPAVIAAAVDAFRSLGAREVVVAEGPGHRRDSEYLLTASGLYDVLKERGIRYVDLNYDDIRSVKAASHYTNLNRLYLPETLFQSDILVSMPKLKTHHWAGVTLSLKNMFGVIPGSIYGWPKNVLHWSGIEGSILDINSTLSIPQFAIVDGIMGMEGNGPLQGEGIKSGVLIVGDDLVAVDATAARLMSIEPHSIGYLEQAGNFLGNIAYEKIEQVGENLDPLRQDFRVIESFQYIKTTAG